MHRWLLLTLALCGVFLGACGTGPQLDTEGAGVRVVATTTQIGALTREVAGGQVRLTVLLQAGADAHDYEANPRSVKAVSESAVVLKNGIGLDDWLDRLIDNAGGKHRVVLVTEGVPVMKATAGDEVGEDDPHVWHDPANAKIMVDNIVKALSEADPAHAELFAANGQRYNQVLDDTDAQVRALIDSIPAGNRKMVTNHDAFGYFIARYGLEYVGAIFPVSSKEGESSAKQIAAIQNLVRTEQVKAIFAEAELDPKVATQLAKDSGVKIVTGLFADSLGAKGSGGETIDGMLLSNARLIAEALR
ncbi:MAG: zinc ABC transporter substrate-binding protein [bacterium]